MDSLGDRMKSYENVSRDYLTPKIPVIARIDGQAFHTLLRKSSKPFDNSFILKMQYVAETIVKKISAIKLAYHQSDEISFLFTDYNSIEQQPYFGYNKSKIISTLASLAGCHFNPYEYDELGFPIKFGIFDARAANYPKEEIANYFLWRAKDWIRNSKSMFFRCYFKQSVMQGAKLKDLHTILLDRGIDWNALPEHQKYGTFFTRDKKYSFNPTYQSIQALIQDENISS